MVAVFPGVGVAEAAVVGETVGRVDRHPVHVPGPRVETHRVGPQDPDSAPDLCSSEGQTEGLLQQRTILISMYVSMLLISCA